MKRSRGSYAAGGTSPEIKEYRAQLAAALKKRGVTLDVFLEANNTTSYAVSSYSVPEREGNRRRRGSPVG